MKYGRAVEKDPNFAEAWFYLGSAHNAMYRPGKDNPENLARLEEAIEAYKKSLEVNKGETENQKKVKLNTLAALTAIYSDDPKRDYDTAYKYAEQLVAENPNDAKNLYAMANLYEKFEKVDDAERMYKQIAEQNPNDPKACGALAGFYNKPLWTDETGANRSKFDEAVTDPRPLRAARPQRSHRLPEGGHLLLGQGLPRPAAHRRAEAGLRPEGAGRGGQGAGPEAGLLRGRDLQGPAHAREGQGHAGPEAEAAVPGRGGDPGQAGPGPAEGRRKRPPRRPPRPPPRPSRARGRRCRARRRVLRRERAPRGLAGLSRAPVGALSGLGGAFGRGSTTPPASSIIFSEMIPMRSTPAPLAMSMASTTLP